MGGAVHIGVIVKKVMEDLTRKYRVQGGRVTLYDLRKQIRARGIHSGKAINRRRDRDRRVTNQWER